MSRSPGQNFRRGDTPRFALPLLLFYSIGFEEYAVLLLFYWIRFKEYAVLLFFLLDWI